MFVERSNRQNTYRAISIAKRWPEFATTRTDGSGVFMTKTDLQTALTAELGKEPHRQTIKRVWETLVDIGGDDVVEKTRRSDGTRPKPRFSRGYEDCRRVARHHRHTPEGEHDHEGDTGRPPL